jgi:hypothetical protein
LFNILTTKLQLTLTPLSPRSEIEPGSYRSSTLTTEIAWKKTREQFVSEEMTMTSALSNPFSTKSSKKQLQLRHGAHLFKDHFDPSQTDKGPELVHHFPPEPPHHE